MAIYHFSAQVISRSTGRSSVAASAYRSGEKLEDERTGIAHDYTKKSGVEHSEILAPQNAPKWVHDREKLWNEVEKIEKRKDAQTAREINVALPKELNIEQQKELIRNFTKEIFVDKGMVADIAIHDNNNGNPHAHIMLTMREINPEGFGLKNREWNSKDLLDQWREQWAEYANQALEKEGQEERIDHRSLEAQGIDRIPQIHVGVHANAMDKKNLESERAKLNREIKSINEQLKDLQKQKVVALEEYKELRAKLDQEKEKDNDRISHLTPIEKTNLTKAEEIVGEQLNYDNASAKIAELNSMKAAAAQEYEKIKAVESQLQGNVSRVERCLNIIAENNRELASLEKNVLGMYKDRDRAQLLKDSIKDHEEQLTGEGYTKGNMLLNKHKLEQAKETREIAESKIASIDQNIKSINAGIQALRGQEFREFCFEYKKVFPQAHYLTYEAMQTIKGINKELGRMASYNDIKELYHKSLGMSDKIINELKAMDENERRLLDAKQALNTIDETKDIMNKYYTKTIGRDKFQRENDYIKQKYDAALSTLEKCGVRNRLDLSKQMQQHNNNVQLRRPDIENKKANTVAAANKFEKVVRAMLNAMNKEKSEERRQRARGIQGLSKIVDIERQEDRDMEL